MLTGTASADDIDAPLAGLTVLDFSTLLPGPMASAILAGHGAHVVKIERVGGEDMRRFPPRMGETSVPYLALNSTKTILELDLKSPEALEKLRPLITSADILIEQFRPGVMARLGFGFEAMKALNPRLIYVSITGYGQSGPRAREAGHDINYQARSGLLGQSLSANVESPLPPALIADIAGGAMNAVTQILLALRIRDISCKGCHLDVSMSHALNRFLWYQQAICDATGQHQQGGEGLLSGASPRYALYKTADARFLAVGALEDKFWNIFTKVIGLPEELAAPSAVPELVKSSIALIIAAQSASFWRDMLEPVDCCCCIVATFDEVRADPHFNQALTSQDLVHKASASQDLGASPSAGRV